MQSRLSVFIRRPFGRLLIDDCPSGNSKRHSSHFSGILRSSMEHFPLARNYLFSLGGGWGSRDPRGL